MNPTQNVAGFLLFVFITVGAIVGFFFLLSRRLHLLKIAQPIDRFNEPARRIAGVLKFFIGQRRILNYRFLDAGIMHAFIFWGFLVVAINSLHFVMGGFVPGFQLPGFATDQPIGSGYGYLRDIFEALVVVMVLTAFVRRLIIRPWRITQSWDAFFILSLILILMLTDFLMSGAKQSVSSTETSLAGTLLIRWFPTWWENAGLIFKSVWWLHLLAFFGFLLFLPLSKHFHVVTSIFSVYFKNLGGSALPKLDIENSESFGISKLHQFTWKDLLDVFSCTECGRCTSVCPAYATGKPLSPKAINEDLRHYLYRNMQQILAAESTHLQELELSGDPLVGNIVSEDTLWSCTTCRACEDACPLFIEFIDRIVGMRRYLVLEESRFPKELTTTFKNLENNANPWGIGAGEREAWTAGLAVPLMRELNEEIEVLFWVGCAGAFDERNKKITRDLVKILQAAHVQFGILGQEENCTGDAARRAGNEYLFQMLAETNVKTLNNYHFKKIVTQCPHCYNTLKNEYPQFGGNYNVVHHSEFIRELLDQGQLRLRTNGRETKKITYHDSCYLGRHNNIYDAPRTVLSTNADVKLQELPRRRNNSFCCGAGGARMWQEEKIGSRINHNRVTEIVELGVDMVATACPFCLTMISDGLKDKNQEQIRALDIAEIVAESLSS